MKELYFGQNLLIINLKHLTIKTMIYFFSSTRKADKLQHPVVITTNGGERRAYALATLNFRKHSLLGFPKRIIVCLLMLIGFTISYADGKLTVKGNTYTSSTGRVNNLSPITTGCTWVDSKGVSYPIFMSANGSCYIIKVSKKTGKEYKNYLGAEVSQDICKKLSKEYKGKKK